MKRLSIVLFFCLAITARAEDCSEIRLDKPGGSMEHVAVRNQGLVGNCYAYAAAQMVDAFRFSQPAGDDDYARQTSAFEAAIGVKEKLYYQIFDDSVEGGDVCEAISYLRKYGSCSSKIAPEFTANAIAYYVDSYFDKIGLKPRNGTRVQAFDRVRPDAKTRLKIAKDLQGVFQTQMAGELSDWMPSIKELSDALEKSHSRVDFLRRIAAAGCEGNRVPIPAVKCKTWFPISGSEKAGKRLVSQIDGVLSGPAPVLPVGIGYCSGMLTNRKLQGIKKGWHQFVSFAKDCGLHSSLVIGRRLMKTEQGEECQYLIRNSRGDSCDGYAWDCEKGSIWVSREALEKNISDIETISK